MTSRTIRCFGRQTLEEQQLSTTPRTKNAKATKKKLVQRRKSHQIDEDITIPIQQETKLTKIGTKSGSITSVTSGRRKTGIKADTICRHAVVIENAPAVTYDQIALEACTLERHDTTKIDHGFKVEITEIDGTKDNAISSQQVAKISHNKSFNGKEKVPKKKSKKTKTTVRASPRKTKQSRVTFKATQPLAGESDRFGELVDDPISCEQRTAAFSSPIVKADWEDGQPDWRCTNAIDY